MQVTVRLYSTLREKLPPEKRGVATLDLPPASTLKDLLTVLGIDIKVVCSINGQVEQELSVGLQEGDEVRIFRPSAGGSRRFKFISLH
ncbi:MAG: MoaD/ThiS family protein [Anaerolineales bacterium]